MVVVQQILLWSVAVPIVSWKQVILFVMAMGFVVHILACKNSSKGQLRSVESSQAAPRGPLGTLDTGQSCVTSAPYPGTNAVSPQMTYGSVSPCANAAKDLLSAAVPPFETLSVLDMPSPNYRSRYGASITGIVVHHTTGGFDGAVSHLRSASSRVSAHMVIGRSGQIARLVDDNQVAWHAAGANTNTLGVEIEATVSLTGLTEVQEKHLISLIKYWTKRYGILTTEIKPHRSHIATACPGYIWPTDAEFQFWRSKNGL